MDNINRVVRIFAASTQIFPARDVYPFPEPTLREYKLAMKVQLVWTLLTIAALSGTALLFSRWDQGVLLWIPLLIAVALAILPQVLVAVFRLRDRQRKDTLGMS